jgi:hypothetical protein
MASPGETISAYPLAGVIIGPSGHLYGTTFGGGYGQGLQGDGVVFEVVQLLPISFHVLLAVERSTSGGW